MGLAGITAVVCVKAVPDPKMVSRAEIDPSTGRLRREDTPLAINPLDRHALEEALRLKESRGASVTAVCMGPPAAAEVLREALAMGADRAVHLTDKAFAGADAYATARTLACAISRLGSAQLVVICGAESSDSGTALVGPELAYFLGVPFVTYAETLEITDEGLVRAKCPFANGYRVVETNLPALVTVGRGINSPRGITFSGVVKARSKELLSWSAADIGMDPGHAGERGSPTSMARVERVSEARQGTVFRGDPEETVTRLVQALRERGLP